MPDFIVREPKGLTFMRKSRSTDAASSHRRPARGAAATAPDVSFVKDYFFAISLLAFKTRRRLSTVIDAKVGCRMQITNANCLYGKEEVSCGRFAVLIE